MKNFRTFQLAVEFYKLTKTLSLHSALKQHLSRAAPSIALNLAEGHGKGTSKDQNRFFQIALGSARECQAILILAELQDTKAFLAVDKLAAHIYKLIKFGS